MGDLRRELIEHVAQSIGAVNKDIQKLKDCSDTNTTGIADLKKSSEETNQKLDNMRSQSSEAEKEQSKVNKMLLSFMRKQGMVSEDDAEGTGSSSSRQPNAARSDPDLPVPGPVKIPKTTKQ